MEKLVPNRFQGSLSWRKKLLKQYKHPNNLGLNCFGSLKNGGESLDYDQLTFVMISPCPSLVTSYNLLSRSGAIHLHSSCHPDLLGATGKERKSSRWVFDTRWDVSVT